MRRLSISTARSSGGTKQIDVLIPAIEKDLGTLPYVIDSVRRYVRHPIGRILIVSPDSDKIKQLCLRKGCTFVNEKTVLPITKKHIRYRSRTWDRSGWLYQQLLKLSGNTICTRKHYLVIDADTVLIRPHRFLKRGKTVFYCRNWSQGEYFNMYRRLLGRKASASPSFVAHYMLFDRSKVARLKKTIEARHGLPWYRAIIRLTNKAKQFGFSEYETYGNFFRSQYPGRMIRKPTLNKSLSGSAAAVVSSPKIERLARKYRSLSFHKRKIYVRRPKN